jgi:hypothetical protein
MAPAVFAATQDIPSFDVAAHCRRAASRATPVGNAEACLRLEQEAREQLAKQWPTFAAADKTHCLGLSTLGGEPTYTELLSCLELARDARNAGRATDGPSTGTSGQGAR